MRARHQRKTKSNTLLLIGVCLTIIGAFLLISVLDPNTLLPGDLTYRGPIGDFTYSGSPEKEIQIFVGVIFLGSGIGAIIKSNRSN